MLDPFFIFTTLMQFWNQFHQVLTDSNQELGAPSDTVEVGKCLPYNAGIVNGLFSPLGLSSAILETDSQCFQFFSIFLSYNSVTYIIYFMGSYPMPSSPLVIFYWPLPLSVFVSLPSLEFVISIWKALAFLEKNTIKQRSPMFLAPGTGSAKTIFPHTGVVGGDGLGGNASDGSGGWFRR